MTVSEILLPEYDQEFANARKVLEVVPEEKFSWKPHDKSMTLGRLASHVAETGGWAALTILQDKLELTPGQKPFSAENRAELLAAFDRMTAEGRAAIAGAHDAAMGRQWSLLVGGHTVFTMPRAAVLRTMVMNHMIHHRAQLSVYLRLLDVKVLGMYGPTADDRG